MKISLKDDIKSISHVKANLNEVLKTTKKNGRPVIITQNGSSAGVVMDIDTWTKEMRKIELLKAIHEGEMSLKNGKTYTMDEVFEKYDKYK